MAIRLAGCVSQVSPSLRRYLAANMAVFWFMTRLFGVSFGVLVLD